jgi:hypothetical protein
MHIETAELFGINTDHKDAYENDLWYDVLGYGGVGWANLGFAYWRKFFGNALGSQSDNLIPASDREWLDNVTQVFEVRHTTRLAKSGKNFRVFLPMFNGTMDPGAFFTGANGWYTQRGREMAQRLEQAIPGITDPTTSIDLRVNPNTIDLGLDSAALGFKDEDDLPNVLESVKSIRIISAPCMKALEKVVPANVIDAWGQNIVDDYQARQFLSGLLRSRIVILYFELEVSNESAQHICQGEPRLSLLGEYFVLALGSEHLFGQGEWCHNVVPISNIAKGNAASKLVPIARTDENGLTVDAKGNVLWIPSVDNTEFVEAEIEQGGMQPNGEWARNDAIDPENTEYIVAPGAGGRNVRQRKPKGRNKLIYTDWHNARLSYTDDAGSLELLDLSMYRKAGVGQLARLLNQPLNNLSDREGASNLHFAIERGAQMGARVPNQPELYERFFNVEEANELTKLLNEGQMKSYVDVCQARLEKIMRTGEGGPRRWTAEEIQAFDPIWENDWLKLDLLHANSPVPFLRQLADMLRQSYDLVMANQDQVFGRYVVTTTLKEMALLLVVVKYAGQRAELHSLDLQERAKYVEPDLAPADQIEVANIPFVSGNVELFPHQVKGWNYLKNAPKNVVLDVAAGGGKTLMALLDIAYHLGKGMRLPLIACPENLIKNYINDALWLFAGKMNMVVLNGTTFNSPEWGEEKLLALVQHAPPNTIFLTDYNFIIPRAGSKRVQQVMYGTEQVQISLNTEFLKRIQWGGIWMDESHLTKNAFGSTNKELMRLTATIPYKRQLSGTYISDNLTDVVGQFGLLNPQTFGDMEAFEEEYFEEGTRRSAPIPGAQRKIRAAMNQDSNVITIRRKEWAALLPRRSDNFWAVEMTSAQKAVYSKILEIEKEKLEREMAEDPEFAAQFNAIDEDARGENDADVLDSKLTFYLQRLERFITAPGSDPYVIENPNVLTGADLISPKVAKLVEVIREHKAKRVPGKILVWTQYVESSASLFRSLPPEIQSRAILYTSGNAEEAMAEFASNPNKDVMVGCEKSMNTGHNLQFCSRICRMETVWNWGTLEQGEARINRPTKNDPRRHENGGQGIYYDWIFCNKSMDVTKNARMISKLISTVKFYEQNNQAYQDLPELVPIKLSKENIFAMNDWQQEEGGCLEYFRVYAKYAELEQIEFDSFVNDPANRIEPYTLEEGEILEGSGLLKNVPYIPQMQLYGSEKLGLIPWAQYVSTTYGTGKHKKQLLSEFTEWSPEGLKVHTEYGDCVVKGFNKGRKTLRVLTPSGETATVLLTMTWVITKESAKGEDIRTSIARKAGVDVGAEIVPTKIKQLKTKDVVEDNGDGEPAKGRKPADNNAPGFGVFLETYNHQLSLVVNTEDADAATALPELTKMGFVQVPDYNYTKVANWKVLRAWVDAVSKKVEIHPDYLARLEEDIENWKTGKTMERFAYGLSTAQRKNFMLAQKQPLPKGIIKPYLVSHNHKIFLCANVKVNAATWPRVKATSTAGVSWKTVNGEHWLFLSTKQAAQAAAKELFAKFNIVNRKELVQQFAEVRVIKLNAK